MLFLAASYARLDLYQARYYDAFSDDLTDGQEGELYYSLMILGIIIFV